MIWPFRSKKIPDQRGPSDVDKALERAQAATERAEHDLERTREQDGEVHKIAEFLRERRKDNHFGEGLMRILRGDEPK